ncbi:MAG: hypothetical protein ABR955_10240 [Verrucomicrobiota bacterium]|jgi:hypothetical protein
MIITLRHFVAIGLTTALAFGVFQSFEELLGHPTTFDMVCFILTTFFGSLGAISLLMFPIVTTVERLIGKRRVARSVCILALPALIPAILLLLTTLFNGNNQLTGGFKFPFLELALSSTFAGSILFCAFFYFYCGVVWFTANLSHKLKHWLNPA